jgi:hypothetical protein
MHINEGVMSEIDLLVNEYKEYCQTHGREPNLTKCFEFVKANMDDDVEDKDLYPILKNVFIDTFESDDLEEAKKVVESFGYRILKEAEEDETEEEDEEDDEEKAQKEFLEQFDDDIAQLITELAEYTGNEIIDAKVEEGTGIIGHAVTVSFGREEYECYNDYDTAEAAAKEDVKSLIEDCGGVMQCGINFDNLGGRNQYIDEDDAKRIVEEDLEQMLVDMSNRDKRKNYGTTDDEEIVERQLDGISSYVDYIVDNWGEDQLDNLIKHGHISFDEDQLAQDCVDADGVAHNLASYDGDEIELDGWWAYRVN